MEILNPRETASLIWFVALVSLVTWKADAWGPLMGVVRSFCQPIILRVIGMMAAWVAGSVWLLSQVGLWAIDNLKTTIIWFFFSGLGWMVNVQRWEADPGENVRARLKEILGVTTFVTFFVEFYTFNLWGELIFVPVISVITLVAVFAQGRAGHELVAKVFGGLMSLVGAALLAYAAYRLISDLRGFATPETGREFAVPGLLSLLFIPFMYGLNVYSAYSQVGRTLKFGIKEPEARRFAETRLFLWFGLDVALLRRWRPVLFRVDTDSREAVQRSVTLMKRAKRRERRKPPIPIELGWSPYRAKRFLAGHGLKAGNYDPDYGGGWSASSPLKTLTKGVLGDSLKYEVTGTEAIATKLTLTFTRDRLRPENEDTPHSSIKALAEAVSALIFAAFGTGGLCISRTLTRAGQRAEIDGITVELLEDDGTKLVIQHPTHVEITY